MYQNVKWTPGQEAELEKIWTEIQEGNEMSTPANPGSGVGNVHKPGPLQKKPVKKQPAKKK